MISVFLTLTLMMAIVVSLSADQSTGITIASPQDYQVFQRSKKVVGTVYLQGKAPASAERVEARISGSSISGPLSGNWFEVKTDPMTGAFNVAQSVPAGGWYRLDMRASDGGKIVSEARVDRFGVGEVFVTAGQSNSTSCGQFPIKQASGMVASFDGSKWRLSEDPQPGAHDVHVQTEPVFFGGSPWPAFGDALWKKYGVPVGVATTGHGGSSVTAWRPGSELFVWTLTRIKQLGRNGFRAVLWHQGESDVQRPADEYYSLLAEIIDESNKQAGWKFPWFVAQVSYCSPANPSFDTTRTAQERLWRDGAALQGPDTDTLTGDNRDYDGQGIHFSPKGLKAHGEMWAGCVGMYLDKTLK